jgi:hypothetical protein
MNKAFKHLLQHRVEGKRSPTAELREQLAPLEERRPTNDQNRVDMNANHEAGTIVVGSSFIPTEIMERAPKRSLFGMEPVVLVILGLMLAFIAFVAWQISQMPAE